MCSIEDTYTQNIASKNILHKSMFTMNAKTLAVCMSILIKIVMHFLKPEIYYLPAFAMTFRFNIFSVKQHAQNTLSPWTTTSYYYSIHWRMFAHLSSRIFLVKWVKMFIMQPYFWSCRCTQPCAIVHNCSHKFRLNAWLYVYATFRPLLYCITCFVYHSTISSFAHLFSVSLVLLFFNHFDFTFHW